jgi:hypothetical protein
MGILKLDIGDIASLATEIVASWHLQINVAQLLPTNTSAKNEQRSIKY